MNNGFRFDVFRVDTNHQVKEPVSVTCLDCRKAQQLYGSPGPGSAGMFFQSRSGELEVSCGNPGCGQVIVYQPDEYPV